MNKAVVVFVLPEPTDQDKVSLGLIIETAKTLFAGIEGVTVHAAVRDAADSIMGFLETGEDEDGNLVAHAKRELARINNDEDFNNSIINAVRAFGSYGHSGGSASVAIPMLYDLLQFKNLTPLTDDKREWMEVADYMWQSTRNPDAFSTDHGKTYYLLSEGGNEKHQEPLHTSEKVE